ncbi:MAG: redoxin domain-containing protein, partial [Solirubrobacterales bacterium]|nr:redoxin domain-containing protein [Solirubrobacterales bacterium]
VLTAALILCAALVLAACGGLDDEAGEQAATTDAPQAPAGAPAANGSVLTGIQPLLNGEEVDLDRYKGQVVLVVNTASECGFTPQFEGLEALYKEKSKDDFVILGFPADDIANQEPRDDAEIAEFCEANFGVTFPMFSKSNVVEEPVNPLFAALAEDLGEPTFNFNKYLLDRKGRPVERFDASVEPNDPELLTAIDAQL